MGKWVWTFRRKVAEPRLRSLHRSKSSSERLWAEQTVPDTEMIETFIKSAMNNANPLSIKKYLHASCKINPSNLVTNIFIYISSALSYKNNSSKAAYIYASDRIWRLSG